MDLRFLCFEFTYVLSDLLYSIGVECTDNISYFLDEIGLYDWCSLPDGSVGATDFAIPKLFKILEQYNSNTSPEDTLVLINKALDVYHQQGDISSIFIVGGSKTLSQISESTKRKKTIYLTENQILRLNLCLQ